MNQWNVECCVIGAGVVGLAVARSIAISGREVLLLEQESLIGSHTSSRNSEVIHAGIYYPKDSLKARHCVAGKKALYEFCASHNVPHSRCGKLIVATNEQQQQQLEQIQKRAQANGVDDLQLIDQHALNAMEPELNARAALLSPSTGIIDSHSYMLALQGDMERHGGLLSLNSRVTNITRKNEGGYCVTVQNLSQASPESEPDLTQIECHTIINSAGLFAASLLQTADAFPNEAIPEMRYAKGNYFQINSNAPFSHLIYPVPEQGGLGVHLTLDLSGRARFGPDVEWLATQNMTQPDYSVDPSRQERFYDAIRQYWPALNDGALNADYCGIRPKVVSQSSDNDFVIQTEDEHGMPNWVNLLGIESPGLTASLSLGEAVCTIIRNPT